MPGKEGAVMNRKHTDLFSRSLQTSGHVAGDPEKSDGKVPTLLGVTENKSSCSFELHFPFYLGLLAVHGVSYNKHLLFCLPNKESLCGRASGQ